MLLYFNMKTIFFVLIFLICFVAIYIIFQNTLSHLEDEHMVVTQPYCTCPSETSILEKYGCLGYSNRPPVQTNVKQNYRLRGYLYRESNNKHYKILPLYGTEYRGGFFLYNTQIVNDGQLFSITVTNRIRNSPDYISREIYDGDTVYVGAPVDGKYVFREMHNVYFP